MLLIIFVLIIMIVYFKFIYGEFEYICIVKTNKNTDKLDDFIYKMYIYKIFHNNYFNKITKKIKYGNYDITLTKYIVDNMFAAYFYHYKGLPPFTIESFEPVDHTFKGFGKENINLICKFYNEIQLLNPNYGLKILIRSDCLWKFAVGEFKNRPYEINIDEKIKISCFYDVIENLSPGNQWTLHNDQNINKLIKKGYIIECFGSSYNSRMKYFGSLNEVDEPCGRIGTFDEILKKLAKNEKLKWRDEIINPEILNITVNPPSSTSIVFLAHDLIVEVLKNYNGKINILFDLPRTVYYKKDNTPRNGWEKSDPWKKSIKKLPFAWDKNGIKKDLKDGYWLEIHYCNY